MLKFALSALALTAFATAASAHSTFEQTEVVQGATSKFVLRVPHGCNGQATLKLRIQIPDGLVAVKPMPKAGWTLETVSGPYSKTYNTGSADVSEGVTEITWTGELPDAWYDEFVFRGTVTDAFPVDSMLFVPVVQECADGAERWIEIPAAGQDAHDLEMPAPGVKVVAGGKH
jgi:periplasmic copper chaperone A